MHVSKLQGQTLTELQAWASEGQTLMRSARALGIDSSKIAQFEGEPRPGAKASAPRVSRAKPAGAANGSGASAAKVIAAITAKPGITRKEIAQALKVSEQTLDRHVAKLMSAGRIRSEGQGSNRRWFVEAGEPAAAGA